jgi:hypothetical protein
MNYEEVRGNCIMNRRITYIIIMKKPRTIRWAGHVDQVDRLCGLVVRVPGYTTEMYCASCEVRTEYN